MLFLHSLLFGEYRVWIAPLSAQFLFILRCLLVDVPQEDLDEALVGELLRRLHVEPLVVGDLRQEAVDGLCMVVESRRLPLTVAAQIVEYSLSTSCDCDTEY